MSGKAGMTSTLPTTLPARYTAGFPWQLDRRCRAVREVAADLLTLWQDLGGVDSLSAQERSLCERVVFLRRQVIEYEQNARKSLLSQKKAELHDRIFRAYGTLRNAYVITSNETIELLSTVWLGVV